jgi:hypothetical protein
MIAILQNPSSRRPRNCLQTSVFCWEPHFSRDFYRMLRGSIDCNKLEGG